MSLLLGFLLLAFALFVAVVLAGERRRRRSVPFLIFGKGRRTTHIVYPTLGPRGVEIDLQTGRIKL